MAVLVRDGFVDDVDLRFERLLAPNGDLEQMLLTGVVHCLSDVDVAVTKHMAVRWRERRLEVVSVHYRYHAWRVSNQLALIRYDHQQTVEPHYHRFGPDGEPVDFEVRMPRLDAVIREAVDLARHYDAT